MKKQFKAKSKKLLDMMINSIYTHKEIFLRELISNASDAIDKIYYQNLKEKASDFNKDDYYIEIVPDKENRTLTIKDTGIGMNKEELEKNLGTIAHSGSLDFKNENQGEDINIIGQFGVGFYSAFMVADKITVKSKKAGEKEGFIWESKGAAGYSLEALEEDIESTKIILKIKENVGGENYDSYLEADYLKSLIKKYSDFIRYPIKMEISEFKLKEGSDTEYEEIKEIKTINTMIPIWKKNKKELTDEDYQNFYQEKHYDFDKPLAYLHSNLEGAVSYSSILYIPEAVPYNYYSKEYEKGLELYSNNVLIMNKCPDLLPDYFSFIKGLVDSDDLSLNVSRELLQHDRQLKLIAKNIVKQIKKELLSIQTKDREKYEIFFKSFGRQLKYGIYANFAQDRDVLEDLIMFYSSKEDKLVTLKEYVEAMKEEQKYIYYATGESIERIKKSPQIEVLAEKGYELLYLLEDVDEFALKVLANYKEKEFKSVSSVDLGFEKEEKSKDDVEVDSRILAEMKEILGDKVSKVVASKRLKSQPVCLIGLGDISIEMEKVLNTMPDNPGLKAEKVLEVNVDHQIFKTLKASSESDKEQFKLYTRLLYNQALLIEGLPLEDPVEFSNNICKLMV